jgi:hypothetical protein
VTRDVSSRDAWFTTTKEAQKVEDKMAALEQADPAAREAELPDLDRKLLDLTIDQDTFEVLYRRRLQLAVGPQLDVHDDAEPKPPVEVPPRRLTLGSVLGFVVAALTAVDLALTAWLSRRSGPAR